MNQLNKFLEKFWLAVGIVAAAVAVYMILTEGLTEATYYLLFAAGIAGLMFGFRRGVRKRMERDGDRLQR